MNLEKLLELVFKNPDDISIEYSNINGEEKLIVNGEDLTKEETYNDSEIKEEIAEFKNKIEKIDDYIFELVIEEAEKRHFDLNEMNKGLDLEHYTEEDEFYASNVIKLMSELIREVIAREIQKLEDTLEQF